MKCEGKLKYIAGDKKCEVSVSENGTRGSIYAAALGVLTWASKSQKIENIRLTISKEE